MIKNEKQLQAAKERLLRWKDSFEKMKASLSKKDYAVYCEVHQPVVAEIEHDIQQHENLEQEQTPYFADPVNVGPWLIKHRRRTGLTQTEVAKRLGVTQSQISRDEEAEYQNSPLNRICDLFLTFGYRVCELAFYRDKREMQEANYKKIAQWSPAIVSQVLEEPNAGAIKQFEANAGYVSTSTDSPLKVGGQV